MVIHRSHGPTESSTPAMKDTIPKDSPEPGCLGVQIGGLCTIIGCSSDNTVRSECKQSEFVHGGLQGGLGRTMSLGPLSSSRTCASTVTSDKYGCPTVKLPPVLWARTRPSLIVAPGCACRPSIQKTSVNTLLLSSVLRLVTASFYLAIAAALNCNRSAAPEGRIVYCAKTQPVQP